MRLRILNRTWEFRRVPNMGCRGSCDPPDKPGKAICLLSSLRGEEALEVLIHECLHAAGWHIDEQFVAKFSADAARAAFRPGVREFIWPEGDAECPAN